MGRQEMLQKANALIQGVKNLPTIPETAIRINMLLDNPEVDLEELADIILADQAMASRIIKIVNSPLFKPLQEIDSLRRALIYLGLGRIREIALTCSFIITFAGEEGAFDIKTFWKHSFGVGIVSRIIAQRTGYQEVEKAYICGIVHDIGEVFLSNYLKDDFLKIIDHLRDTPSSFLDAERLQLGTSHCEIGQCLGEKWNFPPEYCEAIAYHHSPAAATLDPPLVAIVNLADLFCSVRQLDYGGRGWVTFDLAEQAGWKILQSFSPHLAGLDVERFFFELDERVPEITDLVESIFTGVDQ